MLRFFYTISRDAIVRVSAFFTVLFFISGCVPSPDETGNTPPKITDLRTFFLPQSNTQAYLWHHYTSTTDSSYLQYLASSSIRSSEGFSPIWKFIVSDTLKKDSTVDNVYISDSLIILYYGKAEDSAARRQILLQDTLQKGAKWVTAEHFITSNGTPVQIQAEVTDFYGQASAAKDQKYIYNDVFLVSYSSVVKNGQTPIEPEYKNGARIDRYIARNIGIIREICKDSRDSTVWTNELLETRP